MAKLQVKPHDSKQQSDVTVKLGRPANHNEPNEYYAIILKTEGYDEFIDFVAHDWRTAAEMGGGEMSNPQFKNMESVTLVYLPSDELMAFVNQCRVKNNEIARAEALAAASKSKPNSRSKAKGTAA